MISPRQACPLFLIGALFALGCEDSPRGSESRPDLVKDFIHYYIEGPNQEARVFGATFLGMRSIQNPADMWALQEIISEVAPDFIVETGTFHGGSALYLATILKNVNPGGKVITIDRRPWVAKSIESIPSPVLRKRVEEIFENYIEVIRSDSTAPKLIESLAKRMENKKVLVTLDSCHDSKHVLKELQLYSGFVSLGSYLVVQDTFIDDRPDWIENWASCPPMGKPEGGPGKAVQEFLDSDHRFEVDRSREKFLLTYHPSGYLKRVR